MKKLSLLTFLLLFFSKQSIASSVALPDSTDIVALAEEMNKYIKPLNSPALELTDKDLEQLHELSSVKIIGMGEATHGTKEFFQMKQRLFKYFVEHFNHKILAFEMDYSEALVFENYIQTGEGDLTQLMKDRLDFWTWCSAEVQDLFEWMKDYNVGKAPNEKLHLFGIDCQTFEYNVPELINRIAAIDLTLKTGITEIIDPKATDVTITQAQNTSRWLNANKDRILQSISPEEYEEMEHISRIIIQTAKSKNDSTYEGNLRDQYMAENTIWLSNRTNFPMSVWAHNDHVKKGENIPKLSTAMGFYINQKLPESYKNIGFSFAAGSVTAFNGATNALEYIDFPSKIKVGYSNQLLSSLKYPNYIFKSEDVYKNAFLKNYFDSTPFFQIGGFYSETYFDRTTILPPLTDGLFDYMIHINNTTHSNNYRVKVK